MKNIKLSLIAIIGLGAYIQAGGDISPITYYETDDEINAIEEATIVEVPYTPKPILSIPTIPNTPATPTTTTPPIIIPVVPKSDKKEPIVENSIKPEPKESFAYVGVGGVVAQYDTNCKCSSTLSGTDKSGGIIVNGGYSINQYIGIEARGIKTIVAEDGGEIEHIGLFIKPSYPITDNTTVYGLVGWAKTTTTGSLRETDVDGLAFGAGVDYSVTQNISLFADYERLFQESDAPKLDAISIGANYKF
jgi:OOP family OmpA-OmpF porin